MQLLQCSSTLLRSAPPPGAPSNAGKVLRYWVDLLDTALTVQVCFFLAAVLYKWRMDGRKGAEALVASLAAFGFAEKLLEFAAYKRQAPPMAAFAVWCAAAVVCFACAALLGAWSLLLPCCSWCVETARWCFD
ncbi:hypothetical protein COO60DRAFT_1600966 [Scenedesmus sp. NREL 46B-D3]|nr:hypothetical protein COO60DRAFT_1600966 [Scenedesmus sp. NREL 46B-D3]